MNEPQKVGSVHGSDSPESCAQVRQHLDASQTAGSEHVTCVAASPSNDVSRQTAVADASPVWCESGQSNVIWATRRGYCIIHDFYMQIINPSTGQETGRATYVIKQEVNLKDSTTSPTQVEEFTSVTLVGQSGDATNNTMDWNSACVGCSVLHQEPWSGYASFYNGQTRERRWNREVSIPTGGKTDLDWNWSLRTRAGGVELEEPYQWGSGQVLGRCDNQVAGNFGCIAPRISPTLPIDYATRQAGATLVAVGSQVNNHWWGWEEKNKPLTRLEDDADAEANRDIICPVPSSRIQWSWTAHATSIPSPAPTRAATMAPSSAGTAASSSPPVSFRTVIGTCSR